MLLALAGKFGPGAANAAVFPPAPGVVSNPSLKKMIFVTNEKGDPRIFLGNEASPLGDCFGVGWPWCHH